MEDCLPLLVVNIQNNNLGDNGFGALIPYLEDINTDLETLILANNNIEHCKLKPAKEGSGGGKDYGIIKLRNLDLSGNKFWPHQYMKLASVIASINPLQSIDLSKCWITDDGAEVIFNRLEKLRRI